MKKSSYERTDRQMHVQNPHSNQELHNNSCKQIVRTGQGWLVAGISQKKNGLVSVTTHVLQNLLVCQKNPEVGLIR